MRYTIELIAKQELEVEADNEEEAKEKAHEILDMRDFCVEETNVVACES